MANSSAVNAGDSATAAQYDNLRLDVLDPTTGHTHNGTDSAQIKLANNVGILGLDSAAVSRTLLKLDGSNVLQVGGTGMTVNFPVAVAFGSTLTLPASVAVSGGGTLTLPTSTDTLIGRATTDTLTNKTLTSPTINGAALSGTFSGTPTFSGVLTLASSLVQSGGTTRTIKGASANSIQGSGGSYANVVSLPANSHGVVHVSSGDGTIVSYAAVYFVTGASTTGLVAVGSVNSNVGGNSTLTFQASGLLLQARGTQVTAPTGAKYWIEYAALDLTAG